MADTVTNQIYDGARNAVFKVTDVSDGTGLTNYNVTNVASLVPNPTIHLKVVRIWYAIKGMSVRLQWAANVNVDIAILSDGQNEINFDNIFSAGLPNNGGTGVTGDILLTTIGASANSNFIVTIECIKGVRSVG